MQIDPNLKHENTFHHMVLYSNSLSRYTVDLTFHLSEDNKIQLFEDLLVNSIHKKRSRIVYKKKKMMLRVLSLELSSSFQTVMRTTIMLLSLRFRCQVCSRSTFDKSKQANLSFTVKPWLIFNFFLSWLFLQEVSYFATNSLPPQINTYQNRPLEDRDSPKCLFIGFKSTSLTINGTWGENG